MYQQFQEQAGIAPEIVEKLTYITSC